MVIGGFENIGIVAFQKNMEFGNDFRFFFFRRLAGFVVTITLAIWLHSYWAMVLGTVAARTAGVGLSFWMHEFRPRISFSRLSELWSFSQWVLVRNLGVYGQSQLDKFLVGRRSDAGTMGAYTLADEVAAMPTTELLAPLGRVLFPVFVKVADDAEKLRDVFCKAIGVQSLFALPAGVGLALTAEDAVLVLLGEQWRIAIPFLQTLALMSIFSALSHSSAYLLLSLGKVRLQAWLAWIQLALLGLLVLVIFPEADALSITYARLFTSAAGLLVIVSLVLNFVEVIEVSDFLRHTWRPLFATGIMAFGLVSMPMPEGVMHLGRLAMLVAGGAGLYGVSLLLLWRAGSCPDGAEAYLLEKTGLKDRLCRWMRVKE
jgi:O-antigen/teichoic acid export membrane protein